MCEHYIHIYIYIYIYISIIRLYISIICIIYCIYIFMYTYIYIYMYIYVHMQYIVGTSLYLRCRSKSDNCALAQACITGGKAARAAPRPKIMVMTLSWKKCPWNGNILGVYILIQYKYICLTYKTQMCEYGEHVCICMYMYVYVCRCI